MNHWRVQRCYGFGAGHVPLLPDAYRHPPVPDPFFSGLRCVSRAMFLDDGAIRRLLTTAPVFAIALAVLWLLIAKLTLVPGDHSDIEVVLMRTVADPIESIPQPLPAPLAEVEAPRAALRVAEAPAAVQPPEPAVEIPTPVPAPRTRLATVEPSVRSRIIRQASPEVSRPRLAPVRVAPAALVADFPPVPVARRAAHSEAPVTKREREAPATERERRRPILAAVPIALAQAEIPQRRVQRNAPRPPRAEPRARTFAVAALETGSMPSLPLPRRRASSSRRSQQVGFRSVSTAPAAARTEESLSGVPLGVLAACVSDREEDSLKQKLLASVGGRRECRSPAGSYRFVEMKNLNAFLMWIERAPGREVEDRCGELRRALHCLGRGSS